MIAKLSGTFDSSGVDWLIIDVAGVGYQVYASGRTLSGLPVAGERLSLMIETLVRNEQTQLFGFTEEIERVWFRLLLSIQGVGAKVALALLTALTPDELNRAIIIQDRAAITQAEGVGPKLAGRILAELKEKVGGMNSGVLSLSPAAMGMGMGGGGVSVLSNGVSEAVSALVNLGYRRLEAVEAVAKSCHALGADASTEALVRHGLNLISGAIPSAMTRESA
jgi:Holliday junction DNA helicase RuvA